LNDDAYFDGSLTYKLFVTYDTRIELNLYSFRVIRRTLTNEPVGWVRDEGITACVANRRGEDSFVLRRREMLKKNMLDAPKTARSENGNLRWGCSWDFDYLAICRLWVWQLTGHGGSEFCIVDDGTREEKASKVT